MQNLLSANGLTLSFCIACFAKHYYPVGKQADFVQQETKSFLDRVYRGSFGEMLTTMVKQEQLSEQDLKQLRQLLEETEEKG